MPDVLRRSVAVVGQRLDDQSHAARRIALIRDLLVPGPVAELAGPPLDRALDVVPGDRRLTRLLYRRGERHVAFDVPAALPGSDLDGP